MLKILKLGFSVSLLVVEVVVFLLATIMGGLVFGVLYSLYAPRALVASGPIVSGRVEVSPIGVDEIPRGPLAPGDILLRASSLVTALAASQYWAVLLVVVVLSTAGMYPFLSRVYVQLPVAVYRLSTTPSRIYLESLLMSLILSTPVVLPLMILLLATLHVYNLPLGGGVVYGMLPYWILGLAAPLMVSSLFLASGRLDYSLIASIAVIEASYIVIRRLSGPEGVALGLALALAPMAYSYLRVSRWRWLW